MKKLILFIFLFGCSHLSPTSTDTENSAWAMKQAYVILISIDGYRHDYTDMFHPPTLTRIRDVGVSAESLIPIYPSKTFASHFSMITGDTAEHSGISANEFYDPSRHEHFSSKAQSDGTWYLGHPLWEAARAAEMLSASFFWVSSDVKVHGVQPTYWIPYDVNVPNSRRVDQVLKWLSFEPEKRPHFITLYFSNVDKAGHLQGAASKQVGREIASLDKDLAVLMKGVVTLRAQGLPVNVIVVSDHGMDNVSRDVEYVDDEANLSDFEFGGHGPEMQLYLKEGKSAEVINSTLKALRARAKHYQVYKRAEVPASLHYRDSSRIGDLVLVVDEPFCVETHSLFQAHSTPGNHGWDARKYEKMRGIFYAEGPAFKSGVKIPAFENYNIYSVITHVLSLQDIAPVDSQLGERAEIFSPTK